MITTSVRTGLLLAALAFAAGGVAAQSPAEDPEGEVRESAAPAERADEPAIEPDQSADSPLDYESSEQISEDLSVSFPVDI